MIKTVQSLAFLVLFSFGLSAQADGFICLNQAEGLKIQVYNQVQPELGTRNGAVMVLSDDRVAEGRKTIAVFKSSEGTLINSASSYRGKVDLRRKNLRRKGEDFMETKLGQVAFVELHIDFNYGEPVSFNDQAQGELVIQKRNGEALNYEMECFRYLKIK